MSEKPVGEETTLIEPATGQDLHDSDADGITRSISLLSVILGFALIGIFLTVWIQQVLISRAAGALPVKEVSGFWQVWTSAVSANYLFLIVGLVLCLLATHLMNRSPWNVIRSVSVAIAALAALVMIMGMVAVLVNLNTSQSVSDFNTVTILLRILVEIAALIAIVVLELRGLRGRTSNGGDTVSVPKGD